MKFPTRYDPRRHGHKWLSEIILAGNQKGYHPGIDFNYGHPSEDEGQDVIAITDGIVKHARSCRGWGWHVLIYHPKYNVFSHCAHLQSICVGESEEVKEGQLIGFLGNTGNSTSPHLHFEIRCTDRAADKYVTGMTQEEVEHHYTNPEQWIKEKGQEQDKQKPDLIINQQTIMMKLIINPGSEKVYAIGKDNKKHWIFNRETFDVGKEMALWGSENEIEQTQDDPFEEGHSIFLVKY